MTEEHTAKTVWGQKKRCPRGTSNSHNPQLTWTSAQSKASHKVRGDASTYINHERSHHRKNSNAHKRHSVSVCKHFSQRHIFSDFLVLGFCISRFICFVFMFSWVLFGKLGSLGLCAWMFQAFSHLYVFFSSLHLCSTLNPFRRLKSGWLLKCVHILTNNKSDEFHLNVKTLHIYSTCVDIFYYLHPTNLSQLFNICGDIFAQSVYRSIHLLLTTLMPNRSLVEAGACPCRGFCDLKVVCSILGPCPQVKVSLSKMLNLRIAYEAYEPSVTILSLSFCHQCLQVWTGECDVK